MSPVLVECSDSPVWLYPAAAPSQVWSPTGWSIPARKPPLRAVKPGAAAPPFSEAKLPLPQNQPPYRDIASGKAAARTSIGAAAAEAVWSFVGTALPTAKGA